MRKTRGIGWVNQMMVTGWCPWATEGDLLQARGCPVTRLPFPLPPKTGTKWQAPSCVTRLHFFFLSPPLPFPHTRGMSHCSRLILLLPSVSSQSPSAYEAPGRCLLAAPAVPQEARGCGREFLHAAGTSRILDLRQPEAVVLQGEGRGESPSQ